jgi:glycerol kinase
MVTASGFVMAIDQGTAGTRVILFDRKGDIHSMSYREITPIYPRPGWVEHDPEEIWRTVIECAADALKRGNTSPEDIVGIGVTNQRESIVMWEKSTGRPVYNSINWQCRRTAALCDELKRKGHEKSIMEKTGLVVDPYFSATKIQWVMENVKGVREKALRGGIYVGNIDSWIIWKLSNGGYHVTDFSNASRTMLLNIHTLSWDAEILEWMDIPQVLLPELRPSSGVIAETDKNVFFGHTVPIAGVAGDQQSAAFGQCCFDPGMVKCTFGTALSMVMNTGSAPFFSKHGLLSDLAWKTDSSVSYALEGAVYTGGAVVQWLRDGMRIIKNSGECSTLAERVPDTAGVYLVPAFTGLCAPYWDPYARGMIIGITAATTVEHIARAAIESMAYQVKDIVEAMMADTGTPVPSLRVDGGATKSDLLLQFQADILGIPIEKPAMTEMTALGACYLAGLGVHFWESTEELKQHLKIEKSILPGMEANRRKELYHHWKRAVQRSRSWYEMGE